MIKIAKLQNQQRIATVTKLYNNLIIIILHDLIFIFADITENGS